MRKLTLASLFTCFMVLAPSTASAQLSLFQGNWTNTDPATAGTTRLQISTGAPVTVHAWGKCHPTDCDLGTVDGFAYGPTAISDLNTSAQAISAIFKPGFSEIIFIIRPASGGRLQVDTYTRFTDTTGRTAYTLTSFFAHRRGRAVTARVKTTCPTIRGICESKTKGLATGY